MAAASSADAVETANTSSAYLGFFLVGCLTALFCSSCSLLLAPLVALAGSETLEGFLIVAVFEGLVGLTGLVLVTGVVGVDFFVAFFVGGLTTFDLDNWEVLEGVFAYLVVGFVHTV